MCQRRHTIVLPLSAVKKLKRVRVSPPGVVPQQDRRARTVSDLTDAASPMPGVNETTVPLAPADAMQFGQALRRLLFKIYRADPRWGYVYIAKDDILDRFYNVFANVDGVKRFGIILPALPGRAYVICLAGAL